MITPTVGRIVHFRHQGGQPDDKPLAAIIADVISERVINIGVFNQHGGTFDRQHVQLLQDDDQPPHADYCTWMDYQKGQAAKTEALEQQLASVTKEPADPPADTGEGNGTQPPADKPPATTLDSTAQI